MGRMTPAQMEQQLRIQRSQLEASRGSAVAGGVSADHSTVSLAGLLNALDGLHAGEGRIVVMTTNRRDRLDKALIRPGRIDVEVPFVHTTSEQLRDLFTMFYSSYEEAEPTADHAHQPSTDRGKQSTAVAPPLSRTRVAASDELRANAETFAQRVPANRFTAAEVMGYMLKHDTQQSALEGAAALATGGTVGERALVALPNALRTGRASADAVRASSAESFEDVGGV